MPSFTDVVNGADAAAPTIQQVIDALKGTAGKGVPLSPTAVNDAINFALAVKNNDAGASKAAIFYKADGTVLLQIDKNGVVASPDGVAAAAPLVTTTGAQAVSNKTLTASTIDSANNTITTRNAALAADVARANLLINGGMAVQQRGPGGFSANNAYTADRWQIFLNGGSTITVNPSTGGAGPGGATVPVLSGGVTWVGDSGIQQTLKFALDGNAGLLRGQTISLSARVFANTAAAVRLRIASDGTGPLSVFSAFHAGDSIYRTLTIAGAVVPIDATYVIVQLYVSASCSSYGFTNANLVIGTVAPDFVPLPYADELARCNRYFQRFNNGGANLLIAAGQCQATTTAVIPLPLLARMGGAPSLTISAASDFLVRNADNSAHPVCTGLILGTANGDHPALTATVAAGLVAGNATVLEAANGTGWLQLEWNP